MKKLLKKENRLVLVIALICLIVTGVIVNYTYSFFAVTKTNNTIIAGEAESMSLEVDVEKIQPSGANKDKKLIPQLDAYITSAVIGTQGNCVDDNNNAVCQVYKITVQNTGSSSVMVNGTVELNNRNNPNLKWAKISGVTEPTLLSNVNTPIITNLTKNETFVSGDTKDYYIVVWISETGLGQTDTGTFNGVVNFVTTDGSSAGWDEVPIDSSGANAPKYTDGLIPVMYDTTTSKWVKADTTSSTSEYGWYDYDQKKWANAVLVRENEYVTNLKAQDKDVVINNSSIDAYVSSIQDVYSSISFTFTTGVSGGDFSFDYKLDGEEYSSLLTFLLNDEDICNGVMGSYRDTYTTTLLPNTEYTLEATLEIYGGTSQAEISNIVLPEGSSELVVTSDGDSGWNKIQKYSKKYYDSYRINESTGKYNLKNFNNDGFTDSSVRKYICSDGTTQEGCSSLYQIKEVNNGSIIKVDEYELVLQKVSNPYKTAEAGTPLEESDILAFYVWIPRYKYKVWNINKEIGVDSYNAQTTGIDIEFESATQTTGTVTCNDYNFAITDGSLSETCTGTNGTDYYTHPAFAFGDIPVTGFWMGKFEISEETQELIDDGENVYAGGPRTDLTPRILPNKLAWTGNMLSNYYKVIKDMQVSNNIYGLSTSLNKADSHMLTNMEWGAVAYLTHSDYGRCEDDECEEMAINTSQAVAWGTGVMYSGNTGMTSGLSDGDCDSFSGEDCLNIYTYETSQGVLASTTGNIYGIYDMSGLSHEYVMGNVSSTSGSYTFNVKNAGTNYTYNTETSKYINTYAYGTSYVDQAAYNRARLGDATGESKEWNEDYSGFPSSSSAWFTRGGAFFERSGSGVFAVRFHSGDGDETLSSRAALIVY